MDEYTIRASIDKTRERIRQISDDSVFPDQLLYSELLDARNVLVWRNLNKKRHKPKFLYKSFCMPLSKSKDIPCNCVPANVGCTVLKSKFKMPRYMTSESADELFILSSNGDTEFSLKEPRVGKFNKYTRTGRIKPYAAIFNEYLYIIGYPSNKLRGTLVEMIPEDPASLDSINLCEGKCYEENLTSQTCYDITQDTFNIEGHLHGAMIDMVVEKLVGTTMKLPEDRTNTSESTPKEITI